MLTTLIVIVFVIALILAIPLFVFMTFGFIRLRSDDESAFITAVKSQTIQAVVVGNDFRRFISNVVDDTVGTANTASVRQKLYYDMVKGELTFVPQPGPKIDYVLSYFGYSWVNWLYPNGRIHEFEIDTAKLAMVKNEKGEFVEAKNLPIKERLVHSKKLVKELRWQFPRYVAVPNVQLSDGGSVGFLAKVILQVVDPLKPIFTYNGAFFPLVDVFVIGRINDFASKIKYKTGPEEMQLVRMDLTSKKSLFDQTVMEINSQIEKELGLRFVSATIYDYEPSEDYQEIEKAAQAEAAKELAGKGQIAEAKANAKTAIINARAKKKALDLISQGEHLQAQRLVSGLTVKGASPDVVQQCSAQVLKARARAEMVGLTSLTEVEAGNVVPTIPVK